MCNYHTWFHNNKCGYVIECKLCNKVQVCFGNMLLSFDTKSFETFRQYVERNLETASPEAGRNIKSIVLTTGYNGINIILSGAELEGLHYMIDYADTEMKAAAMMKMFDIAG